MEKHWDELSVHHQSSGALTSLGSSNSCWINPYFEFSIQICWQDVFQKEARNLPWQCTRSRSGAVPVSLAGVAQLLLDTCKCWGFAGAVTRGCLARTPPSGSLCSSAPSALGLILSCSFLWLALRSLPRFHLHTCPKTGSSQDWLHD